MKKISKLQQQRRRILERLDSIEQMLASTAQQTYLNTVFIEWATTSLSDDQVNDLAGFMRQRGIEVESDPSVAIPESRIIIPGFH